MVYCLCGCLLLFQAYNVGHGTGKGFNLLLVGDGDVLAGNLLDTGSKPVTEAGSMSVCTTRIKLRSTDLIFSVVEAFWP